jgi:hypothetical protein
MEKIMTLFWVGFVLFFVILLLVSFFVAQKILGRSAAVKNMIYFSFAFGVGIAIAIPFIVFPNGFTIFGYVALGCGVLNLLNIGIMLFRNQNFKGNAVYTFNSTTQNKIVFCFGIFQIITQPVLMWLRISLELSKNSDIWSILSRIGPSLMLLSFGGLMLYYSQKAKAHENGLSCAGFFVRWERILNYKFEGIAQNIFHAKYKGDLAFIPGVVILSMHSADKFRLLEMLKEKRPDLEPTP